MKQAPILLGSQRMRRDKVSSSAYSLDVDDNYCDPEYDLFHPHKLAIADDSIAYQLFGEYIFCAPREDLLEGSFVIHEDRELF
jgi:hypothetical protein